MVKTFFIGLFLVLSVVPLLVVANAGLPLFQPTNAISTVNTYAERSMQESTTQQVNIPTQHPETVTNSDIQQQEAQDRTICESTEKRQGTPNLVAYWGIVDDPEPIGELTGVILSLGYNSQTQELIQPWLVMKGPYEGDEIHIRFPLEENPFNGLVSYDDFAYTDDISGSYWGTVGDPGDFIAFFDWNDDTYWIMGDSYDMDTWLE
jgi:hypothetical protein